MSHGETIIQRLIAYTITITIITISISVFLL